MLQFIHSCIFHKNRRHPQRVKKQEDLINSNTHIFNSTPFISGQITMVTKWWAIDISDNSSCATNKMKNCQMISTSPSCQLLPLNFQVSKFSHQQLVSQISNWTLTAKLAFWDLTSGVIPYHNCTTLSHNYVYKLSSWCCATYVSSQNIVVFIPVTR